MTDSQRTGPGPRVGLLTGGLGTYWTQFPGLLAHIQESAAFVAAKLRGLGAEVIDEGIVSDSADGAAVAERLRRASCDVVVMFVSTYMTAGQMVAIARECKVPILLLELQPTRRMEHPEVTTPEFLRFAGVAGLPELCNVLARCDVTHDLIVGHLQDDVAWARVARWVRAASVVQALRGSRFGLMGHLYPGMLDIASNLTSVIRDLGVQVEIVEVEELRHATDTASTKEIAAVMERIRSEFVLEPGVDIEHLELQARVAVALEMVTRGHGLSGLAYFFFGNGDDVHEQIAGSMAVGATLQLTDGRPVGTEFDLRAVIAMSILNHLQAASMFTELYSVNYEDGVVEVGHDGGTNLAMVESTRLRPLDVFHGKSGSGNAIESTAARGPITLLALAEMGDGSLRLVTAEGAVVAGTLMSIGNTVSRVSFRLPPGEFVEAWSVSGSGHHFAMGRGHVAGELRVLARLLGLTFVQVGE